MTPMTDDQANDGRADDARVLVLLRTQVSMYARLEALAGKQRGLIAKSDATPLLRALAERQELTSQLTRIADDLAPVRREWKAFRGRLADSDREEADRLVKEAGARLETVMASDDRDVQLLSAKKEDTAQRMRSNHARGAAVSAYARVTDRPPRLDRVHDS